MLDGIKNILHELHAHNITIEEAYLRLKEKPFEDIGYAKIDLHRQIRKGASEVIYGAGKTPEQIAGIIDVMKSRGQGSILITRLSSDSAQKLKLIGCDITYYPDAQAGIYGAIPEPEGSGYILVATGGTSDIPVAEESALTAEFLGNTVKRLYDVGVAGLHRVLSHIDDIMRASVIIAVAGMEGALASVIGGLADCPVIAVPTSVGYGASFGGVSALLAMLNSCASGVSVVNIDNGFGAGYLASMINRIRTEGEMRVQ
ncbi:MAG: nickel pincer cofactor biosynthesis protein LarB [Synergistaceae bacterium]|nr:nickel pincer cofactor biosynthesis protein LarB [Synergistaceae bacterium]